MAYAIDLEGPCPFGQGSAKIPIFDVGDSTRIHQSDISDIGQIKAFKAKSRE